MSCTVGLNTQQHDINFISFWKWSIEYLKIQTNTFRFFGFFIQLWYVTL